MSSTAGRPARKRYLQRTIRRPRQRRGPAPADRIDNRRRSRRLRSRVRRLPRRACRPHGSALGRGVTFRDKLEHLEGALDLRGQSRTSSMPWRGSWRVSAAYQRCATASSSWTSTRSSGVQERFRRFLATAGFSHPVITRLADLVSDAWSRSHSQERIPRTPQSVAAHRNQVRAENATLLEKVAAWEGRSGRLR
jgi:hypothetical protein